MHTMIKIFLIILAFSSQIHTGGQSLFKRSASNERMAIAIGIDSERVECIKEQYASLFDSYLSLPKCHEKIIMEYLFTTEERIDRFLNRISQDEKNNVISAVDLFIYWTGRGVHFYMGQSSKQEKVDNEIDNTFAMIAPLITQYGVCRVFNRHDQASNNCMSDLNEALSPDQNINIKGIDKAVLLKTLYEHAPRNQGFFASPPFDALGPALDLEYFRKSIEANAANPDYLNLRYWGNRPIKIDIRGDRCSARLYNRDNGRYAAHRAIEKCLPEAMSISEEDPNVFILKAKDGSSVKVGWFFLQGQLSTLIPELKHLPDNNIGNICGTIEMPIEKKITHQKVLALLTKK